MKKIIIGLTLFCSLNSFAAPSYFCEEAYKAKLAKIEKNRFWRDAGKTGIIAGFAIGGLFIPTIWLGGIGVISGIFSTGPILGTAGAGVSEALDKEAGLISATELFALAQRPRDELKQEAYKLYVLDTQARKNYLQGTHYTEAEIAAMYPIERFRFKSLVDVSLDNLNKSRSKHEKPKLTYSEFQAKLAELNQTDAFCGTNKAGESKPQTLRQVIKTMKRLVP